MEQFDMDRRSFLGMISIGGVAAVFPAAFSSVAFGADSRPQKGMVSFTFDDGIVSAHQTAFPVLKSRGQVATAGIVAGMLGTNDDYMNARQVRELEQNGWEIASHGLTHTRPTQIPLTLKQEPISGFVADKQHPGRYHAQYDYDFIAGLYQDGKPLTEVETCEQLTALPGAYWYDRPIAELHVHPLRGGNPAKLNIRAGSYQREMEESKRILTGLGFTVDTFIAPYNYWTDDVAALCKLSYARACIGKDSDNRADSFDPFAIKRFMGHTKDSPQSIIRIIREHALAHNSWVLFCLHGVGQPIGWEPYPVESLDRVSAWVAEQGIPVVTVRQGTQIMRAQATTLSQRTGPDAKP